MGSSSSPLELALSLKPSYVPKSINHLLTDLDQIDSVSRKLSVLKDYLNKHKEELHKVEQFKRELPQCVLLLMDAIQEIQEQISVIKNGNVEADQPEEPSFSPSEDDRVTMVRPNKCSRKGNEKVELNNTKGSNPMLKLNINADDYAVPVVNNQCPSLSQPILRNNRRIWTSELHSRFLKALNNLGGAGGPTLSDYIYAATPKQVREIMQVKGLTNDQVKSHLQKYRIYKRAGVPGPEAGASSISAESADHLHCPAAMASQEKWTPQSQFPCTTRDFFSTATSIPQYSNSSQHQGDDDPGMHNYGI